MQNTKLIKQAHKVFKTFTHIICINLSVMKYGVKFLLSGAREVLDQWLGVGLGARQRFIALF